MAVIPAVLVVEVRQEEVLPAASGPAAEPLSPRFRASTWRTLIGRLVVTGMRPGEACHLEMKDVDLTESVIQVLETKFGKARLVFLHPTTIDPLTHDL